MFSVQIRLCGAALAMVFWLGCASSDPEGEDGQPPANADAEVDMGGAQDLSAPGRDGSTGPDSAALRRRPLYATLAVDPAKAVYSTDLRIGLTAEAFDQFGESLADPDLSFSVIPPAAALLAEDGRWELAEEGDVSFEVCTSLVDEDGQPVCARANVVVDDGPPTVEILSPTMGQAFAADAGPVVVTGTVSDGFGLPVAYLNGMPLALEPDGAFSFEMDPQLGVNHVEVAAGDGIHPSTGQADVEFLFAPFYDPLVDLSKPSFSYEDAFRVAIGQTFFDDGQGVAALADGTIETHDLADIVQLVVEALDLSAQIPNPVVDNNEISLSVLSIKTGTPRVLVDVTGDGMEVYLQLPALSARTTGQLTFQGQTLDLGGTIDAVVSMLVTVEVEKSGPTSDLRVEVGQVAIAVEDASSRFASPEANAIFALAQSALRTTLEDLFLDVLRGAFVDQFPLLLVETLGALDTSMRDRVFLVDLGLGNSIDLGFDARISRVDCRHRSAIGVEMVATGFVDAEPMYPLVGIPRWVEDTSPTPLHRTGGLQLGVRLGLINGLLHVLWQSGFLELDVASSLPITVERGKLSGTIQPLVLEPQGPQLGDLVLQIGGLTLDLELLGRREVYGMSMETGISLALDQQTFVVDAIGVPKIRTWVVAQGEEGRLLTPEALESLVRDQVWPEILTSLRTTLALPLPLPDLSGLVALSPELMGFGLSFEMTSGVAVRDGYVVLEGELSGVLPASTVP
jgi:hypothetical protein